MPQQQPTVGRIVHYVSHGTPTRDDGTQAYRSQCRAAIVTDVPQDAGSVPHAHLAVLSPEGLHFTRSARHDDSGAPGSWHWPGAHDAGRETTPAPVHPDDLEAPF